MHKTCIVITGPTAVGKTSLAIEIAQHFRTHIISADSRQCFTELNIGVAKPTAEALQAVPHYFINSHSIYEEVNAGLFERYALTKVKEIFTDHNTAVVVGGTGLYIKAFCGGMDEFPAIDFTIRKKILKDYEQKGLSWLQNEVEKKDPMYFAKGENKNPQRLQRALEVKLSTGKSIIEFHTQPEKQRDFNIIKIGIELPKEQLHENINTRVDAMVQQGLLEEVRALLPYKNFNALQTVGYRELFDYFLGNISFERAVELIKTNTRQYAKRQMTWFKKDKTIQWYSPDIKQVLMKIENKL